MTKLIDLGNSKYTAIDDDMIHLNNHKWHCRQGYAVRTDNNNHTVIRLHREVMGVYDENIHIDHINGDRLDNRRENLRICTQSENVMNKTKLQNNKTSRYKGVHRRGGIWIAQISVGKKKIYLGSYNSEEKAAEAYDLASEKYHKEFGFSNVKISSTEQLNYSLYEILPRARTFRKSNSYEVISDDGICFKNINEAADFFKVKVNTVTKACTDKKIVRRVRGRVLSYGKKVECVIEIQY